jgi:TatD DNase family protein
LLHYIPQERLLLETDAPYLAPVPHRGKRNEPAFLPEIGLLIASELGISVEKLAQKTTQTARKLFNLF